MTVLWLLCGLLFGPGPAFVASMDGSDTTFPQSEHYESSGEPGSQIKYLEAYSHSIASVPEDYNSSIDQHGEDHEVEITDDLASKMADVLLLTLNKNSSLSITLKIHRPSAFLKSKATIDDVRSETKEADGESDIHYHDSEDDHEDDYYDHDDEDDYYDHDDEDDYYNFEVERDNKMEMAVLKPGETGILLDSSQTEGVLVLTEGSPNVDSTQSLPQVESSVRRKRSVIDTSDDGDNNNEQKDLLYSKRSEKGLLKLGQTGILHEDFPVDGILSSDYSQTEDSANVAESRSKVESSVRRSKRSHVYVFNINEDEDFDASDRKSEMVVLKPDKTVVLVVGFPTDELLLSDYAQKADSAKVSEYLQLKSSVRSKRSPVDVYFIDDCDYQEDEVPDDASGINKLKIAVLKLGNTAELLVGTLKKGIVSSEESPKADSTKATGSIPEVESSARTKRSLIDVFNFDEENEHHDASDSKSKITVLKPGQTGILLIGSPKEGVLSSDDFLETDTINVSDSLSQDEAKIRSKRSSSSTFKQSLPINHFHGRVHKESRVHYPIHNAHPLNRHGGPRRSHQHGGPRRSHQHGGPRRSHRHGGPRRRGPAGNLPHPRRLGRNVATLGRRPRIFVKIHKSIHGGDGLKSHSRKSLLRRSSSYHAFNMR